MDVCNQLHTPVHNGYEGWLGCYQLLTLVDAGYDCRDMCYNLPTLVPMPQNKKCKFRHFRDLLCLCLQLRQITV